MTDRSANKCFTAGTMCEAVMMDLDISETLVFSSQIPKLDTLEIDLTNLKSDPSEFK